MKIIIGHTNLDLDCIGSMVLARYIFPEHRPVRSRFIHPVARNLFNLYEYHLDFLPSQELKNNPVEHIVVVDTRSVNRVKEYLDLIPGYTGPIDVYDHHPGDTADIPGADIYNNNYGSNTTYFTLELMNNDIPINPDDATISLAAIYSDTGNFTHDNVTDADFLAASYLLQNDASIKLVRQFLRSMKEEHQYSLFHRILNEMIYQDFQGHLIGLSYIEMEKQAPGLAAVVEKAFEVENLDAIFAVFSFTKDNQVLIIARSQKNKIPVHEILRPFSGGGHPQASSALIKGRTGGTVFRDFLNHLTTQLNPAVKARDIMTGDVHYLVQDWPLLDASLFLEKHNHTGAPVVDSDGIMVGFMTLRNIMKGRKGDQMHAPVKGYMTKNVITGTPEMTVREIEALFFNNNIGHLPIVENGKVLGIVTRSDYLNFIDRNRVEGNNHKNTHQDKAQPIKY
ncbi:MAG TPA: CBS domain-containing protein [Spirochaetota bacterium]|nr:CBS domain-containing protein [Spirochaetota bacterium]